MSIGAAKPALEQTVRQSQFVCSACGSGRECDCNAPAVERLAKKIEQDRQRAKAYRERKTEQNQQPRHVTEELRQQIWDGFEAGKSQGAIADELGVSQTTVSRYLVGERGAQKKQSSHVKNDWKENWDAGAQRRWRESFMDFATEAVMARKTFSLGFGERWREFKVTQDLVDAAIQVIAEWTELAAYLRARIEH